MDTALSENGRVVAEERHGNGMVCVNRPLVLTATEPGSVACLVQLTVITIELLTLT
jgi:hypothetical protein